MKLHWGLILLLACGAGSLLSCAPIQTVHAADVSQEDFSEAPSDHGTDTDAAKAEADDTADDAHTTADDWLLRLEEKSHQVATLSARMKYVTVQGLLQDEQTRFGDLVYAAPDPDHRAERFALHLNRENIDGEQAPIDRWLIGDGHWLLDRDHDQRQATRRELAPDQAGTAALPIPLRVDRAALHRRYAITLGTTDPDDADKIRLDFVPRDPQDGDPLSVWFDRQRLLPVRAASISDDGDQTQVFLFRLEENADVPEDAFATDLPHEPNWDVQIVPLD